MNTEKELTIADYINYLATEEQELVAGILACNVGDVDVPLVKKELSDILKEMCDDYCIRRPKQNELLPVFFLANYYDKQVVITEDQQQIVWLESAEI